MRVRIAASTAVLSLLLLVLAPDARAVASTLDGDEWQWPVAAPVRITRPYLAPAHAYGPGHRGVDVSVPASGTIAAPADGVIAFAGQVAGRRLVTIDHEDGFVSTLEPVDTALDPGTRVTRGQDIASASVGGHVTPGGLHFGVRLDGEYVNPLLIVGEVPRAVLLPCC